MEKRGSSLVYLGAGVGNVVMATPLLVALQELGFATDVFLAADYPQTAALLQPWSAVRAVFTDARTHPVSATYAHVLPAIPPFYWLRFASSLRGASHLVRRPPDSLFYQNEQEFYLAFARSLGYPIGLRPFCTLPIAAVDGAGVTSQTLVIAPGCKTGEMAAKRWPYFPELAESFADVAVVGTADDLRRSDGTIFCFPPHVQSFVGQLNLRQTAEVMAAAGAVVGNDSGLSHVAAAVGTPTLMIFGPTPDQSLGPFPPNVQVLRRGMPCEPCWFGTRFHACAHRIDCLRELRVDRVIEAIRKLNPSVGSPLTRHQSCQAVSP